jgi:hypothetical protein
LVFLENDADYRLWIEEKIKIRIVVKHPYNSKKIKLCFAEDHPKVSKLDSSAFLCRSKEENYERRNNSFHFDSSGVHVFVVFDPNPGIWI